MKKKIINHESTTKKSKRSKQTSFVKKITEKVSDIRFMCNINYTWILQLLLPSSLWLIRTNICSTGRDSVIQKFFSDFPPSNRFDFLRSCRFYLAYYHRKEDKKYQHLSISSYFNTLFWHPFYSRTWQLFYLSFPAYDK